MHSVAAAIHLFRIDLLVVPLVGTLDVPIVP